MQLDNLDLYLAPSTLTLPVGGDVYEISEVDGETFLRIAALSRRDEPMRDEELFPLVLGQDLYDELKRKLPASRFATVGITAYFWQIGAHDQAAEYWRSGGKAGRAPDGTQTDTPPTTLTDEATTTPSPASGSGTSTRRKSSVAATEPPSAGTRSSPAGT